MGPDAQPGADLRNAHRTGTPALCLALMGNGAFDNEIEWITSSIRSDVRAMCGASAGRGDCELKNRFERAEARRGYDNASFLG